MAETEGTIGTGVTLGVDPADGAAIVSIAEITDVNLGQVVTEADATSLGSAGIAQMLPGTSSHTCTFSGVWLPDKHDLDTIKLIRNANARAVSAWKITWNDPTTPATAAFSGFITALDINVAGHDQPNTISGTIRIGGAGVTFTNMATGA